MFNFFTCGGGYIIQLVTWLMHGQGQCMFNACIAKHCKTWQCYYFAMEHALTKWPWTNQRPRSVGHYFGKMTFSWYNNFLLLWLEILRWCADLQLIWGINSWISAWIWRNCSFPRILYISYNLWPVIQEISFLSCCSNYFGCFEFIYIALSWIIILQIVF